MAWPDTQAQTSTTPEQPEGIFWNLVHRSPTPELETPLKHLNDVLFIPSEDSQPVNSAVWKSSVRSRYRMLFDLKNRATIGMPRSELQSLLGVPEAEGVPRPWRKEQVEYYSVVMPTGECVSLELTYKSERLYYLRLQQYSTVGFRDVRETDWFKTNFNCNNIARKLNERYFLVGAPTKLLPQIIGHAKHRAGTQFYSVGSIELEYSEDNLKVKRFRVNYENAGKNMLADWEDKDLRRDPRCFADLSAYNQLSWRDNILVNPTTVKFTSEEWEIEPKHRTRLIFD